MNGTWTSFNHAASIQLLMGFTFGTLIAIALVGNCLVCIAVYTNKKLRKKENLYFVSLAGADLLLSILVMPFGAVNEISTHWPFGTYCKYWMCLDILFVTASILHLAAISFDRYIHISNPMRYEERVTLPRISATIFGVWATSAIVAFLPLAFDTNFHYALSPKHLQDSNGTLSIGHSGSIRYQCEFNLDPLYAILSSLASFYIPCTLMILAYGKLYRYARRHSKAIRKQQEEVRIPLLVKPVVDNEAGSGRLAPMNGSQQHNAPTTMSKRRSRAGSRANKSNRMDSDHKARVTLGVIMGVFLASYLPFFIVNIVRSWCPMNNCGEENLFCLPNWVFITLTWMGYANSAQNPIIYTIFNRDFRQAFRKILRCGHRPDITKCAPTDATLPVVQRRSTKQSKKRRKGEAAYNSVRKESPCIIINYQTRARESSSSGTRWEAEENNGSVNH